VRHVLSVMTSSGRNSAKPPAPPPFRGRAHLIALAAQDRPEHAGNLRFMPPPARATSPR
jgi:hypothetical protein